MNVIEAKIYLLQAPGVNRVLDEDGIEYRAMTTGEFQYLKLPAKEWKPCVEIYRFAPFTKVEPEKSNGELAKELTAHNPYWSNGAIETFRLVLDAVDDKIRKALNQ